MEPHPIPQNVTTFQFRLIGDMTLKQFVYLASGCGFAYLLFVFLSASYPLLAWPLIIISSILGVAFAFLPIGSRPLDYWTAAFLKAVYSPTKRAWQKNGKIFTQDPLFRSRYIMYTSGMQPVVSEEQGLLTQNRKTQPVSASESQINRISGTPSTSESFRPPEALPTKEELQKTVDLARQAQALQVKIIQTERTLNQMRSEAAHPTPIPVDYSQQVNKILEDLQRLITQASQIKAQMGAITEGETQVPISQIIKEKIKVIVPIKPKQQQIALTTFPNVINGVIKDTTNNYLDGVIVVIYDKEGLPVRALKTNKLGQFSGSTPLPNGIYTLELEKDNFSFDVLQMQLEGEVLPPLMITSKGVMG